MSKDRQYDQYIVHHIVSTDEVAIRLEVAFKTTRVKEHKVTRSPRETRATLGRTAISGR